MKVPVSRKISVLVSGGVDSAILLAWARKRYSYVIPIYVRCEMKWEKAELFWLRRFLKGLPYKSLQPLQVLSMPAADIHPRHWSVRAGASVPGSRSQDTAVYIPGRNLLLLSKAAVFCAVHGIGNIALGTLGSNPFADAQPQFFRAVERMVRIGLGQSLKIHTPFIRRKKSEIIHLGENLPLHKTFSCLAPRGIQPCGHCNKCAERKAVLPLSSALPK